MTDDLEEQPKAEIVLYQQDGQNVPVQVTYWNESFWLSQAEMAGMFNVTPQTITRHLQNIYDEGELLKDATCTLLVQVRNEGGRTIRREIAFYDLDAIIAVGYRVNSKKATRFRQWATTTLREFIVKGFVLNDDMLKNGRPFGQDYFDELLRRVRDIRASEKRFYVKICDVFQEISTDYDPNSQFTREFYQEVQNRFHYAATGQTAPEIIDSRADAGKPHMGLTTWKGFPEGRIHTSDVTVAKNYLVQQELDRLNRLSSGFLDAIETRIENRQTTTMSECVRLVNQYIEFTGGTVLQGRGSRTRAQASSKAKEQLRKFNTLDPSQLSDFEKQIKHIERGEGR
ncbi:MAG: RhuM family protein [Bifidobacterium sp.]|uniref:RhuM family protein n=1 Tax=Bifidobacterium sp. TaxID=41200 RepID=UPI0039EBAA8E